MLRKKLEMCVFVSSLLEIKLVREASHHNKFHIFLTLQLPPRIRYMLSTPKIREGKTQLAALWGRRDGAQLPLFICLVESFQPLLLCICPGPLHSRNLQT